MLSKNQTREFVELCGYKYTSSLKSAQIDYLPVTNGQFWRHPAVSAIKDRSFYYSDHGFLLCRPDALGAEHYVCTFSPGISLDEIVSTMVDNDEDPVQMELYREIFLKRKGLSR